MIIITKAMIMLRTLELFNLSFFLPFSLRYSRQSTKPFIVTHTYFKCVGHICYRLNKTVE